jgi:ABC-2 type transport system ATP-binding protein
VTPTAQVRDVTFSYRGRRALTGASCAIERGVTTLIGPNGSGKTTFIKCLVGLLTPSSGTITVLGTEISDRTARRAAQQRIGFVPQNPSLPTLARVRDVVGYAGWLSGVPRGRLGSKVEAALGLLRLEDLADRRVRALSGGQRQRLALATGVVHDPDLLVLDEPTVGLDPGQRLSLREVIRDIGRTRAVVLSTHLTEDAQYLTDSVAVLVQGRVRYQGSLDGLTALEEAVGSGDRPGSAFERAYDGLVVSLGGPRD